MKLRQVAILAALVVVVASGGWFFFLRGDGAKPKKPVAQASAKDDPWAGGAKKDPQRPEGDRGGGAPEQVLVDDDPVGTLRLEGLVLTAEEKPADNAVVVVSANPPRTTTTDENGAFVFDKLVGRPYTLVARSAAGVAGPVTAKLTAKSDPVVLRLAPGGALTVTTVDRAGKAVGGAVVELRGFDVQTGSAGADGKTAFAMVVPGRYDVVATAPGFAPSFASALVQTVPVEVNVVLIPGAPVSGRVVSAAGEPVADAVVVYSGASDWNVRADERRDGERTAKDGTFTFAALPAGSFRFVARHPAHAPGSSAIVTLDGSTAKDGVEIRMTEGATVSGVVLDGGGAPVASARVRIGVASRGMIGAEPRQVYSADDGTFSVAGLPRKPLEAVALAESGSSETKPVDASRGDVANVKLTVDITGTIAGVVVDKQGEPLEGVQVGAAPDFRSGGFDPQAFRLRGFPQELTDAGGRFELVGLAPGAYMVRASRSTAARGRLFGMEGERAETGTTNLRIVMPADGGVKGKVAFADGSVPTPFTVGVGFSQEPVASKDGSFQLGELPPRKYQLVVRGPEIDQKTIDVEIEEGEIADVGTITVGKGRVIAGNVMFQGKPVPNATVFAGRQLFGTGSSNTANIGGGPPGRGNNREATTDEDGHFSISGLGPADVTVVAEHADMGRSAAIRLQRGVSDEKAVVLNLAGFGSLVGKATDAAGPAAETIITAQSTSAGMAMYTVATGPDGTYRFDKLAPDTYKVSAMLGMPMRGMTFFSTQATVETGKEARADLAVVKGDVTLIVTAKAKSGDFKGGFAWLVSGVVAAKNGRELQARMSAQEGGTSSLGIMFGGRPATFKELVPGVYSVCAAALPAEVAGGNPMNYLERHGDDLPVFCKQLTVALAPKEQQAEVTVEIPAFVAD
ncbi:MAG TPA: carboxypeptidase-like regulatory domain-containing protein [Kofleriaceae bacterium]|nr:carboxypeptidase-like regulatory domain-containing protein [Kofleriaceae bacterium]